MYTTSVPEALLFAHKYLYVSEDPKDIYHLFIPYWTLTDF
jgi:hypothetical protein